MARFSGGDTQYFNEQGEPLAGGKLYFYESGSTTPKTTYSDADQTVPNMNPVILDAAGRQSDIFFSGAAKLILEDADSVLIDVIDPVGGAVTRDAFADWNALLTYDQEDIVQGSDDVYYKSIHSNNLANDPTSSSADWMAVKMIAIWNAAYTYEAGAVVVGPDDALYSCTVASSTGSNPTLEDDWTKIGASGWSSLIEDTSPQLGGDLDPNGNDVGDASAADLTKLSQLTATAAEINKMDGVTASTSELNTLDGVTVSVVELNRLTGVTSDVQSQIDSKADYQGGEPAGVTKLSEDWNIAAGYTEILININGKVKMGIYDNGDVKIKGSLIENYPYQD